MQGFDRETVLKIWQCLFFFYFGKKNQNKNKKNTISKKRRIFVQEEKTNRWERNVHTEINKAFPLLFHLISIKEKKSGLVPGIIFLLILSLPHLLGQRVKDWGKSELGEGLEEGMGFFARKAAVFLQK